MYTKRCLCQKRTFERCIDIQQRFVNIQQKQQKFSLQHQSTLCSDSSIFKQMFFVIVFAFLSVLHVFLLPQSLVLPD